VAIIFVFTAALNFIGFLHKQLLELGAVINSDTNKRAISRVGEDRVLSENVARVQRI